MMLRLTAVLVAVCCCAAASGTSDRVYHLDVSGAQVSIEPATLGVIWMAKGGEAVSVSSAQLSEGDAPQAVAADDSLSWTDEGRKISVTMRADGDELVAEFRSDTAGTEVTWPVVSAQTSETLFAIPFGMGYAIPAGDKDWHKWAPEMFNGSTMEILSFPALGRTQDKTNVTYIFENAFHNEMAFGTGTAADALLSGTVTHRFTRAAKDNPYVVRVAVPKDGGDPLVTAKVYRAFLEKQGPLPTLESKIKTSPEVAKLIGASHVYVWGGDAVFSGNDIPAQNKRAFFADLRLALKETTHPAHLYTQEFPTTFTQELRKSLAEGYVGGYYMTMAMEATTMIADAALAAEGGLTTGTELQRIRHKQEIITELFPGRFAPIDTWGGAFSPGAIAKMKAAGIDRLWLGLPSWQAGLAHPAAVKAAAEAGYLVGPYDSYHSMHKPNQIDTWETAQFGQEAFDLHTVVREDGTPKTGFKKVGRNMAPTAAMPYVKERIGGLMKQMPQTNSWFFDCDAFGEVFDNYHMTPPDTQQADCAARLARMKWAADTYKLVIGSEGGNSFALSAIDFAHGIFAPGMAWGDPDMYSKEKNSPYYLGRYYPPEAPDVFFKKVPLREDVLVRYFHPQYRLPLQRAAVGDCVVPLSQWANGAGKFTNAWKTMRLTELLYAVPSLDHVSAGNLNKWLTEFAPYYAVNTKLTRAASVLPMTQWQALTADKSVQETAFGTGDQTVRVRVNFNAQEKLGLAPLSAQITYPAGETVVYQIQEHN